MGWERVGCMCALHREHCRLAHRLAKPVNEQLLPEAGKRAAGAVWQGGVRLPLLVSRWWPPCSAPALPIPVSTRPALLQPQRTARLCRHHHKIFKTCILLPQNQIKIACDSSIVVILMSLDDFHWPKHQQSQRCGFIKIRPVTGCL